MKIQWQGEPRCFTGVQSAVPCTFSSVPVNPWLCCPEYHMKPLVLLQGTYSEGSNHSKQRKGNG